MKILEISEYYFKFSGILVLNKRRFASIAAFMKNVFVVMLMGPVLCGTSAAFIYYYPDQFENSVKAFTGICGGLLATGKYLSLKLNENRIRKLIETFQETVDAAPVQIKKMYFDAETKARRLTKTTVNTIMLSWVLSFGLSSLVSAVYNLRLGRLDSREWFQTLYSVIPYEDQLHSFLKYFVKTVIALAIGYVYPMTLTSSVTFLMNCHDLFEIGFFHIKTLFMEMDKLAQQNPQSNFQQIKIRMVRVVKLHNRLLELAETLSKIMSGPLFYQLLCTVGFSAGLMNLVNFQEFDFTTVEALVSGLSTIILLFLYCRFATGISTMLGQIGDVAYQSNLYNYPIDMQKCVQMIIRRTQVPFQFNAMNLYECNMAIFASILRLTCSYYLMLNKINSN